MKIVSLTAENFKRLKAVEITPDGNTVVIAGKNAQGKTSVLDAIWAAVGGRAGNKAAKPIREGADEARVRVDLGDIVVTRTWKGDSSTLKVETAEGAAYKSPQSLLDSFIGRLSFDPLAFSLQDAKQQVADLLELVELPFDPDELARRRSEVFDQRTIVGRDGKAVKARLDAAEKPEEGVEEKSVTEVLGRLRDARETVEERRRLEDNLEIAVETVEDQKRRVAALEEELRRGRASLANWEATVTERQKVLANADAAPDVAALEQELEGVEAHNQKAREAVEYRNLQQQVTESREQWDALTKQLAAIDKEKADGLAKAAFPVDGLGFDDSGVTFNDIPFAQASAAERLRVSMAMAIAMNPKLRVIRITDGSLLDSDNMALVESLAAANDFQVWVERVDESGTVGVLIEDGQVKQ